MRTGAYGIVWKATDKKSKDVVALKKIFDAFQNATDAQRTFREIMYLMELNGHKNIVRLLNVLKADNDQDIYLITDCMDLGESLWGPAPNPTDKSMLLYLSVIRGEMDAGRVDHAAWCDTEEMLAAVVRAATLRPPTPTL